mmetsp:Transcript_89940/g.257226  ORF Transcript_89940/g.257226 Transcript_89940/m.257226 type:complete len:372 (+) Transcript_89940:115-1230(+)
MAALDDLQAAMDNLQHAMSELKSPKVNTKLAGNNLSDATVKICVLGAGAFGTAMATVAARNNHEVVIYARDQAVVDSINNDHINPKYKMETFTLPSNITSTTNVAEAVAGAGLIMHALPAQKSPDFFREHKDVIPDDVIICSTAKGLYLRSKCLLSEAILGPDGLDRAQPMAFLSGPSFAVQIMQEMPTAVVVGAKFMPHAVAIQRWLSSLSFRVYTTQDTVGVELGGALKNPLAVGAGMIEGLGLGINTMAALVTRATKELMKLCTAMGGKAETISGLAGIGDLMLTAFGDLSRNRTCGMRIIQGEKLEDILATTTVEGVPTAEVAMHFGQLCGLQDELPIFTAVAGILAGTMKPEEAQQFLMGRPLGSE